MILGWFSCSHHGNKSDLKYMKACIGIQMIKCDNVVLLLKIKPFVV